MPRARLNQRMRDWAPSLVWPDQRRALCWTCRFATAAQCGWIRSSGQSQPAYVRTVIRREVESEPSGRIVRIARVDACDRYERGKLPRRLGGAWPDAPLRAEAGNDRAERDTDQEV